MSAEGGGRSAAEHARPWWWWLKNKHRQGHGGVSSVILPCIPRFTDGGCVTPGTHLSARSLATLLSYHYDNCYWLGCPTLWPHLCPLWYSDFACTGLH